MPYGVKQGRCVEGFHASILSFDVVLLKICSRLLENAISLVYSINTCFLDLQCRLLRDSDSDSNARTPALT